MRLGLVILLAMSVLTGALGVSAMAEGDLAMGELVTACCDTDPIDAHEGNGAGRDECATSCSSCCNIPAMVRFAPPLAGELVTADRHAAESERSHGSRRPEVPLRPPRFQS